MLAPNVSENVPAPQLVHVLAPVVIEYLPAGHSVHTVAPTTDEYVPMSHVHEVNATHPLHAAPEFVGHASQDTLPVAFLYFPAAHIVHSPALLPSNPTLQTQAVLDTLEIGELESTGQSVHASAPTVALYFPAEHPPHVLPSGPVKPASQIQVVLPSWDVLVFTEHLRQVVAAVELEYVPALHGVHDASSIDPVVAKYFPAPQCEQLLLPVAFLYFPATHNVQIPTPTRA